MIQKYLHRIILLVFFVVYAWYCYDVDHLLFAFSQLLLMIPFWLNYFYFTPWLIRHNKTLYWTLWMFLFWGVNVAMYISVYYIAFLLGHYAHKLSYSDLIAQGINGTFVLATISTGSRLAKEWTINQQKNQELFLQKTLTELQIMKSNINLPFILQVLDHAENQAVQAPKLIEDTLISLSDLLRHGLYESKAAHISFDKELKVLEAYMLLLNKVSPLSPVSLSVNDTTTAHQLPPNLLIRLLGVWAAYLRSEDKETHLVIKGEANCLVFLLPLEHPSAAQVAAFSKSFPSYTDTGYSIQYEWAPKELKVKIVNLGV